MSRKKVIYFLSAFILIIGCYALNLSYSLFTQNIETENIVDRSIPILNVTLEKLDEENISPLTNSVMYDISANTNKLLKLKVNNNSSVTIQYGIKIDDFKGATIKIVENYNVNGKIAASSSKEILLYIMNVTDTDITDLKIDLVNKYETQTFLESDYSNLEAIYLLNKSIVRNATNKLNGTELVETPPTKVAEKISDENEKVLAMADDDYTETTGNKSYYFRGNVDDNYVNFAGMCWRIVRIMGDGSIKLILEDQSVTCDNSNYTGNWVIGSGNFGFIYDKITNSNGQVSNNVQNIISFLTPDHSSATSSMVKSLYDFQNVLADKINNTISLKLKNGGWCYNDIPYTIINSSSPYEYKSLIEQSKIKNDLIYNNQTFYYDSYVRLYGDNIAGYNPTLKCNGEIIDEFIEHIINDDVITTNVPMYVGAITADEIVFAGGNTSTVNQKYYIVNDYLRDRNLIFYSLSPFHYLSGNDYVFSVTRYGMLNNLTVKATNATNRTNGFRPVINLLPDSLHLIGNGLKTNPYVIV